MESITYFCVGQFETYFQKLFSNRTTISPDFKIELISKIVKLLICNSSLHFVDV